MRKCTVLPGAQTIELEENASQKNTRDMLKPMNKVTSLGELHFTVKRIIRQVIIILHSRPWAILDSSALCFPSKLPVELSQEAKVKLLIVILPHNFPKAWDQIIASLEGRLISTLRRVQIKYRYAYKTQSINSFELRSLCIWHFI